MQIINSDVVNTRVLNPSVGTVNYSTGEVRLTNFVTDNYAPPAIKIFANTLRDDIAAPKNRVFVIRNSDIVVNMVESS